MGEKETARLEAFSDGVFAIAITLLVLELKVPHLEGEEVTSAGLGARLGAMWPSYLSLATSFFTILIMWIHHHIIFKMVHRATTRLMFANGVLLLLITVVPFPTAVLAEYLRTPAGPAAALAYAATFVGISIAFWITIGAAFEPRALSPHASRAMVASIRSGYRWGPPLYLVAVGAAPLSPWLSLGICTALWVFWASMTSKFCEE